MKRTLQNPSHSVKRTFFTIIILLSSVSIFAQWVQIADSASARDGGVTFVLNDKIYCVGGKNKRDLWIYDPAQNVWVAKGITAGVSIERAFAVGLTINGNGYVGMGSDGNTVKNDWWQYDTANNQWIQKAGFPGGGRNAMGYFVIGNKAYMGMGTDNQNYYNDFYSYDATTDTWDTLASYPAIEMAFSSGFSVNGKGYIVGGGQNAGLPFLYEYDPAQNAWYDKTLMPMGTGRQAAVIFVINDKAYFGLGQSNYVITFDNFFVYDPITDNWETAGTFPAGGRAWSSSAVVNGKAYVGFGWDFGAAFFKDWWEFTPPAAPNAIEEQEQTLNASIYPVPFTEKLTINTMGENADVFIYNSVGQKVTTLTGVSNTVIDTRYWLKGLYVISVINKGDVMTTKMIKQ